MKRLRPTVLGPPRRVHPEQKHSCKDTVPLNKNLTGAGEGVGGDGGVCEPGTNYSLGSEAFPGKSPPRLLSVAHRMLGLLKGIDNDKLTSDERFMAGVNLSIRVWPVS